MDDITDTLAPKSDQLDAVDLVAGPQTFTITRVAIKAGDQPADIHLAEFPRVWRPNKNTRRLLAAAWGSSKDGAYEGRRVTLYYDPDVEFGGAKVGGVRVSHMSHLPGNKPFSALALIKKGRPGMVTVAPLPDTAPTRPAPAAEPTADQVAACSDPDALRDMWHASGAERRAQIQARVAELNTTPALDVEGGAA